MRGNNVNGAIEKPSIIDVGQIIDNSKLNPVSIGVILLCGIIMLMDGFDYTIITVAGPVIRREWNVGAKLFGFVFSAAFLGYLFGALIFGILSDRIGRKKTLIIASCIFTVGTLLVYFSHSVLTLIPIRVFTGIGIGGAVPCAITLTSEYAPLKGRGKYISVMYSGFLTGIVLGGFVAGFLLEDFGWRPLFLIGFIAPLVAIILLMFKLPESARWLAARKQSEEQRQSLAAVVRKMRPDSSISPDAQFVSAAANKNASSFNELFRGRLAWVTPTVWGYYLISSIAVFFIGSWSPQLLVIKGYSPSTGAYITGWSGVVVAAGCLLSGFYFDKAGFRSGWILHVIAAIAVIFTGGLQAMNFVVLLIASAFFINSAHMDVTILAPIVYPPSCRNRGAGMAIATARIGAMIGPVIGGFLLDTEIPMERLLGLVAVPLVIAAALCYIAGRQYDFYFAPLYAGKLPGGTEPDTAKASKSNY